MAYQIHRRTSQYVLVGSDYSQQEPKMLAFVSNDPNMVKAFQEGKDIYALIASLSFNVPYENCLEFHPETGEYQPDGYARRSESKTIVLGITYGRSVKTIGDQLFGDDDSISDKEKITKAQAVYDAVLNAFPNLRSFMFQSQSNATKYGYVETILGRRRHIPDMQLPEFDFRPMKGYVNPDIDPLDPSTLENKDDIPERIVNQLKQEYSQYKYNGQIWKRNKQLSEENIRVVNNRSKIGDASRECVNCVDTETEILTLEGWKKYNEVKEGDRILSYSMESDKLEEDIVEQVHIYKHDECDFDVVEFNSPTFSAVSTPDHKWVTYDGRKKGYEFRTTSEINKHKWPDYPILRNSQYDKPDNPEFSDEYLHLVGLVLTDGSFAKSQYGISLYQSTRKPKNARVYNDMLTLLHKLDIDYTDYTRDDIYHDIYLKKCEVTTDIYYRFVGRVLNTDFIFSLSPRQANIVIEAMIDGDGSRCLYENSHNPGRYYGCNSKTKANMFQLLCVVGGHSSRMTVTDAETLNKFPSKNNIYPSLNGQTSIRATKPYYNVCVYNVKHAQIYPHHKLNRKVDCVWCVTTNNHTWIARRNGYTYITGNSRIQGSAAELTKMAIIKLINDPRWLKIGGRLLVPIHDELQCEVPVRYKDEAAEILSDDMASAGDFLPFKISCDVEVCRTWFGLEYPCPFQKPKSLDDMSEEDIKWVQYHLFSVEYLLPIYNDENGEKPRGMAAKGVNGVYSSEMEEAIHDYIRKHGIEKSQFIDHIDQLVEYGINF